MSAWNQVTVAGSVGDTNLVFGKNGTPFVKFSIRVGQGKGKDPAWFSVIAFKDLAENIAATFSKGQRAIVTGSLQQSKYTKDGVEKVANEILADSVGVDLAYATAVIAKVESSAPQATNEDPF